MKTELTNFKSTMKHTTISNIENSKCKVSEFTVFSTNGVADWISSLKFNEVNSLLTDDKQVVEYPLKAARKSNEDEGVKGEVGKAIRLAVSEDIMTISVYTQEYGNSWKKSHEHVIDKKTYDAYALVFSNSAEVFKAEKQSKEPVNFTLNLA